MLKLIKLEIKKYKISRNLKGVFISNLIILAVLFLAVFAPDHSKDMTFTNYNNMFLVTDIMVRGVFMIFATVLISRIIIGEYKSKTINVLFLYPINRKKLMLAKLGIVAIFTFTAMVLSSVLLNIIMCVLNKYVNFLPVPQTTLTPELILSNLVNIVIYSAAFALISLIPVYVGMMRRSGSATIVTGIILTSLLNSGSNGNSLSSILIVPVILAIIGIAVSYLSIKDIEKVDVINF